MVHGRREQAHPAVTVEKVTVRYGETANLGNYESVRPDVELAASVPAGQSVDELVFDLAEQARMMVRAIVETEKNDREVR